MSREVVDVDGRALGLTPDKEGGRVYVEFLEDDDKTGIWCALAGVWAPAEELVKIGEALQRIGRAAL